MAEQLVNEFTVNRPIDEAWAVITDVERIAPCLPGAELQEIEGDIYRGVVKVKLGSITPQFKGQATFIDRDDPGHRAVLKAEGRDTGGRGNAAAEITAQAESLSPTSTRCVVTTDLHITGRVAQFGRGILGDVSKKLMAQFASNLNTMLDDQGAESPAAGNGDTRRHRCCHRSARRRRPARRRRRAPPEPPTSHLPGPTSRDRSPGSARSRARPPNPSTSPASPARRSSSASPRCSWPSSSSSSCSGDAARTWRRPPMPVATTVDADDERVAELLGRRPAGRYDVVVRDRRRRPGGDPQRPVARRRHADADALLARRSRRGRGRQPAGGRRRRRAPPRRPSTPASSPSAHARYAAERDAERPARRRTPAGRRGRRHPAGCQVPARPLRLAPRGWRRSGRAVGRRAAVDRRWPSTSPETITVRSRRRSVRRCRRRSANCSASSTTPIRRRRSRSPTPSARSPTTSTTCCASSRRSASAAPSSSPATRRGTSPSSNAGAPPDPAVARLHPGPRRPRGPLPHAGDRAAPRSPAQPGAASRIGSTRSWRPAAPCSRSCAGCSSHGAAADPPGERGALMRHPSGRPTIPSPLRLYGSRVMLRPLVAQDFAAWREVRQRNEAWLDPVGAAAAAAAVRPVASTAKRSCRAAPPANATPPPGLSFGFGLFVDDRFCGEVNVNHVLRGALQTGTIGYWIDERYAGRGLVAEGVVVVFEFAFERLWLHRLEINIVPRNANSRRVMEKLDIRTEGVAVRMLEINGDVGGPRALRDHRRGVAGTGRRAPPALAARRPERVALGDVRSIYSARRNAWAFAWRTFVRRFHIFSFQCRRPRERLSSLLRATSGSRWCSGFHAAPGSCTSAGSTPALTCEATLDSSTWMRCRSPCACARSSCLAGTGSSASR